ncbi:MAG: adenylate/guanylate cyclase domain-containing protein [Oscillospiraceae bacterium]|nr:adenylate/guanylate cyclase domain-containing protein [Oscillospiraceae bacterium]MCL2248343.1 adenylate/guanylate cyclase domain-containing protein [Oscillospiraceae bacterium]
MYKKLKVMLPIALFIMFGFVQYFGLVPSTIDNIIHDNIMASERPTADNIIIVGIDERSINEIGTWPWPRLFVAEAIMRLREMGAAAIGVNVLYNTYGAVPEYDEALVYAAQRMDGLVLGGMGILEHYQTAGQMLEIFDYVIPFDELANEVHVGFLNPLPDPDGVLRRALTTMRFGDITIRSFPLEVYRAYRESMGQTATEDIPLDEYGRFPIRYAGGPGSFRAMSLWGVINEEYAEAIFRDAIVLIGPYAPGIGYGNYASPLNHSIATHGIEAYANIIQNFLEGIFLTEAPWWLNLAILTVTALVVFLMFGWLKPLLASIVAVILAAALLLGAWLVYSRLHIIISIGDILIFLVVSYLIHLIVGTLYANYEKQHIKGIFGRFVAPEVVNEIINGNLEIQLGGVVKEISALFVDIRGFTAFSETNPPETVVEMINRYLALTSSAIQKNNGTIDKYMGDATMALFNAPNDIPNHALCAVKSAWEMKKDSTALQMGILDEYGVDLQFGIGINTGTAVVGNMGSDFRMDYTAIGDAINTAARLEAKAEKGQIIISDATYQQVKQYVDVSDLGIVNVKNKKVGIQIYSVENVK